MQVRELLVWSATVVAACSFALSIAMPNAVAEDATGITTSSLNSYLAPVRSHDERAARSALIIKLREMRDDLRNYAVIARGAKLTEHQKASAKVLGVVKEQISALSAKEPKTIKDPEDDTDLDPLLFELGSN